MHGTLGSDDPGTRTAAQAYKKLALKWHPDKNATWAGLGFTVTSNKLLFSGLMKRNHIRKPEKGRFFGVKVGPHQTRMRLGHEIVALCPEGSIHPDRYLGLG